MKKRNNIIYWISTAWLALGMLSSGIVQTLMIKSETDFIINMGYPVYFLTLIGIWKILGVVALFVPGFLLIKEWTYAGFFFLMSGAIYSHIATGHSMNQIFPPLLLLALTIVSWYFRPSNRRIISIQ